MSKTAVGPETTTLAAPYRFSTEQFDKMVDAGAFGEDDVELLGGAIYPIMTENEPHQLTVERVAGMLRRTLPADQWHVREEKHVEIADDWKPRPDVHVLRGSFEDYWRGNRRPGRHDVVLLVEVCETTHQHDEVFKARGYALARSPLYWLVDLRARRIRVYSKPRGRRYTSIVDFAEGEMLPITIGGLAWPSVPVADLMPPRRSG